MSSQLTEEESLLVETVRSSIDRDVKPTVQRSVIAAQLVARGGI